MATKVDYYAYGSPTAVTTLTLSNCDSTTVSDYKVYVDKANGVWLYTPKSISGSTMDLRDPDGPRNVNSITVVQPD